MIMVTLGFFYSSSFDFFTAYFAVTRPVMGGRFLMSLL
jgi:hypothetical protein